MNIKLIFQKNNFSLFLRIFINLIIIVGLFFFVKQLFVNTSSLSNLVFSAGVWGPLVLIALMILGILLSPIPSVLLIIAAGYLYGVWLGALYSYVAHFLATLLVFFLVRTLHLKKHYSSSKASKYSKTLKKNKYLFYILYIFPVIPISVTSIILGTSKVSYAEFFKISSLSFIIPVLFFSFFGTRLSSSSTVELVVWIVLTLIIGFVIFRKLRENRKKKLVSE